VKARAEQEKELENGRRQIEMLKRATVPKPKGAVQTQSTGCQTYETVGASS
jgi:hypothetical protein